VPEGSGITAAMPTDQDSDTDVSSASSASPEDPNPLELISKAKVAYYELEAVRKVWEGEEMGLEKYLARALANLVKAIGHMELEVIRT
jgi:hypothetical protein